MSKVRFKLIPQCRMMNICEIEIIGNPETHTIIGLEKNGADLVHKMQSGEIVDTSNLNEDQIQLINAMSTNGFFSTTSHGHASIVNSTYLHVTSHCNLRCSGCYSYETDRNSAPDLTLDELKVILDNFVNAGLTQLVISGGEPFSRYDLEEFLAYAQSKHQIQYIECITNGTASLDRYRGAARFLNKLTFSLDSADAESAMIRPSMVFKEVVEKITILQSENIPVHIVFTIHHKNVDHCGELISFAQSLNVGFRFSILTVDIYRWANSSLVLQPKDYQIFHNFIISRQGKVPVEDSAIGPNIGCAIFCGAGVTMVSIASDGGIYPCHMFVGNKAFKMGNALHDDIKEIVNNAKSNPFYGMSVDNFDSCRDCHVRYVCGGGCRFRAYAVNGSINEADPMCETYKDNKEFCIQRLLNLTSKSILP